MKELVSQKHKLVSRILSVTIVYRLNENMLTYGTFRIFVDNLSGKIKTSTNGLPQGTVLAPILFILK